VRKFLDPIMTAIRYIVPPLALCTASLIFCMHWFLLMADSLVSGVSSDVIPSPILSSMSAYYRVVFGPMVWMIKVFILLFLLAMTLQLTIKAIPWYLKWTVFITNAPLVFNGVFNIIPMADRFITNTATPQIQSEYARTIHSAHVISAYAVALMIFLQLAILILLQRQAEKNHRAEQISE